MIKLRESIAPHKLRIDEWRAAVCFPRSASLASAFDAAGLAIALLGHLIPGRVSGPSRSDGGAGIIPIF
jgi:hypothetical protein